MTLTVKYHIVSTDITNFWVVGEYREKIYFSSSKVFLFQFNDRKMKEFWLSSTTTSNTKIRSSQVIVIIMSQLKRTKHYIKDNFWSRKSFNWIHSHVWWTKTTTSYIFLFQSKYNTYETKSQFHVKDLGFRENVRLIRHWNDYILRQNTTNMALREICTWDKYVF